MTTLLFIHSSDETGESGEPIAVVTRTPLDRWYFEILVGKPEKSRPYLACDHALRACFVELRKRGYCLDMGVGSDE